jgi:prolyl oligopeptidase
MIMPTTALRADSTSDLNKLLEDYWQFKLKREPERATYLGDHRYDDKLADLSEAGRQEELKTYRVFSQRVKTIQRDKLSGEDRLSAELFERIVTDFLETSEYPEHLMPIRQQESPQITLGMLHTTHPFKSEKDCQNYAARLRAFDKQVDDMIAAMNEGIRRKVVRPKITIEQSLPQIEAMIADDLEKSELYAPAKSLAEFDGRESSRKLIVDATRDAMSSLKKLRDYLRKSYLPACRDTVGYCHLPDGKAWYRRMARMHTTTDLSPEEMHKIGLSELERIHEKMRAIAKEVGFKGDLRTFIEKMRTDPAQHNKTAEEIMSRHATILKRSDANLHKMFGVLPKIPYELKEMERFRCEAGPEGYYYNAPDDGSRPAYYYINICEPQTRPIYTMESLAYHEAQPGHHFQIALAQEKKGWPTFRRFEHITAFIEGWALYSEVLGFDLDGYRDPYSRFGQLTYDTWRSSRLVVDTGMHYFGWTRQRAIDFMKDNTGLSEQNIISEVDRYIAWPGQALAYKIGQLEILKLRHEAETTLGPRFDIRSFHDHLLEEGSIPLSTLNTRMHAWIESQKGGAPASPTASPP